MRKLLLTSTALVAATSMINYASADVSVSGGGKIAINLTLIEGETQCVNYF